MLGRSSTRIEAVLALAAAAALPGCSRKPSTETAAGLQVAAAADLAFAFKDVGAAYEKKTGQAVGFSFGSTGLLERQLAEGAPFDVFAAANVSFADDAVKSGACLGDSKASYATGRIVLFLRADSDAHPHAVADLTDPKIAHIAIANPEHAPYGKAAKQAMERAGVWATVQPKVVYGENVQQTLQFAQSGNADVAIVALSLATVTPGEWTQIPTTLHEPIDQAMVACSRGKAGPAAGRKFIEFVQSAEGRDIMRKYGFLLPGESLAATTGAPKP
ncbi:MAG TPA: molybdate ABC transporter substrate-binding protein [Polyangiaceae bacterium]|jgi:molybdate transport system substrate-binding protein